jgi:uncharacterized protein YkwD/plastocyanin
VGRGFLVRLCAAALAVGSLLALPLAGRGSEAANADVEPPDVEIAITSSGFEPETVSAVPGQDVHFTNDAGSVRRITGLDGTLDTGELAPGAGFSVAMADAGTYDYALHGDTATSGSIRVVLDELPGDPNAPAQEQIPDVPFPAVDQADLSQYEELGVVASRTRILVKFAPDADLAEANAALEAAGVVVAGGLPDTGLILVLAPDTPDFAGLDQALESLRASPFVELASLSMEVAHRTVPRIAEAYNDNNPGVPAIWNWTDRGAGGVLWANDNWGMENARAPQAWSFREAVMRKNNAVDTGIIDAGFEAHPDLPMQIETLCQSFLIIFTGKCTANAVDDHGNHVAGIIGARYDNTSTASPNQSLGVSGINPVADIHSVPWGNFGGGHRVVAGAFLSDELLEIFDLILDEKTAGGRTPDLRAINFSAGAASFTPANWWGSHPTANCGAGPADDGQAGSTQWCTPNNDDRWLREFAQVGAAARTVAERASGLGVFIVQAASNDSNDFCIPPAAVPCPGANPPALLQAVNTSEFAWAGANWTSPRPNSTIIVEAIGNTLARAPFSDAGGTISAPGVNILSAESSQDGANASCAWPGPPPQPNPFPPSYCTLNGASMAAPHVTGAITYLHEFDNTLSLNAVRTNLTTWAVNDTTGGVQPRLDMFNSMLNLTGSAKALVDVNDRTKDGNRRVILGPNSAAVAADTGFSNPPADADGREYQTAPDGKVGMRDFRRFRDGWLQICKDSALSPPNLPALGACPAAADITLNEVAAGHVKKDLNFDRCSHRAADPAACVTPEAQYPRFDFNGDGGMSRSATRRVSIKADGTPATGVGDAATLTDLQVLGSQWDGDAAINEGFATGDLDGLMTSGDLELHAKDFFDAGANEVDISVTRTGGGAALPGRKLKKTDEFTDVDGVKRTFLVYTVPNAEVQVRASGTNPAGDDLQSAPVKVTLKPGEDKRIDLCVLHLELTAFRTRLPADGAATSRIDAELKGCPGDSVDNKLVTFAVTPNGANHATLDPASGMTDANGKIFTTFKAGTLEGTYTVEAIAELGDSRQAKAKIEITTAPVLKIHYLWRQSWTDPGLAWSESGSTIWPTAPGTMPDCKEIPTGDVGYCIDSFTIGPNPDLTSFGLERKGVLSGSEASFALNEEILKSVNRSRSTWSASKVEGDPDTGNGIESAVWGLVSDAERTKYQNHALPPTVRVEDKPAAVFLHGLKAVGELGYTHSLFATTSWSDPDPPAPANDPRRDPIELLAARGEFLLVPRGDGSAIQYAGELSRPIEFKRNPDGTLKPYSFCGNFVTDLTTAPGYRVASDSTWIPGATNLSRKTTYGPGDRPMPVGPGNLKLRYSFVAVATYGSAAPELALPDCSVNNPPTADFDHTPVSVKEGRVVRFFDRSTDPENNVNRWAWNFGDGGTSTARDPHHFFFDNNAAGSPYNVTLTVTDSENASSAPVTKPVVVENLPPEAELDDAAGQVDQPITMRLKIWDPSRVDAQELDFDLKRNGAIIYSQVNKTAGSWIVTFPANYFTAGTHPLELELRDKDGASDTASGFVTATAEPPPPPPPPPPPVFTCDPTVSLDSEEKAFLEAVNAYRAENELDPVAASPTLTKAADKHTDDMVANDFFEHNSPTDGSTPFGRAQAKGYPGSSVGENLALDFLTGRDVLLGWKSSTTGHNENMLNPDWKAVGISRKFGHSSTVLPPRNAWYWATSYGDVLDCPSAAATTAPVAPKVLRATDPSLRESSDEGIVVRLAKPKPVTVAPRPLVAARRSLTIEVGSASATATGVPAFAAFSISDVTPPSGDSFVVTNRSRDTAGEPLAATLYVPDLPAPGEVELEGGESVELTFVGEGSRTLTLEAGALGVSREIVVGPAAARVVSITGNDMTPEGQAAVLRVNIAPAAVGTERVDWTVTAGTDVVSAPHQGQVTFASGETFQDLTFQTNDDGVQGDRSFTVTLTNSAPGHVSIPAPGNSRTTTVVNTTPQPPPPPPPPAPPAPPPAPPAPPPAPPAPPPAPPAPPPAPPAPPPAPPPSPGPRPQAARCVVPNVKGKTLAQARKMLAAKRCALGKVSRSYSGRVKTGKIISQSKRPGARLARGTRVNVVVSRGRSR